MSSGLLQRTATVPVALTGLTKSFGRQRALDGVTLELHPGEIFGYLGPNGAGKTTTLRILMGFLRPTSGSAAVLGLDAWQQAPQVHRRVGYVAGDVALYERLTGRELLDHLSALRGDVEPAYVSALTARLQVEVDRPIRTLSKGNRQKLAIVQALMARPELLVLDEPTTGLDPLVQQQVHELLREQAATGGTVLLSSHVLSEVQQVADRVGIIRAGRLVTVERLDDLRRKSLHHVTARFTEQVHGAEFQVPGVGGVRIAGTTLTCDATQSALDPLLRRIIRHEVVDLDCQEASLDETFLAYYGPAHDAAPLDGDGAHDAG